MKIRWDRFWFLKNHSSLSYMRTIDHIIIHCSATREDRSLTVAELEENHRCRGFRGIGYHYYIRKDGTVINTRALELVGAHAK